MRAHQPPQARAFDAPVVSICLNTQWASHIIGLLSVLEWEDAWTGTPEEKQAAIDEVLKIEDAMACGCSNDLLLQAIIQLTAVMNNEISINNNNDIAIIFPGAPDVTFTEGTSDVGVPDKQARNAALCMTLLEFLGGGIQIIDTTAQEAFVASLAVIAPTLIFGAPPLSLSATAIAFGTGLLIGAAGDVDAVQNLICCAFSNMQGQSTSRQAWINALDKCSFSFLSNEWVLQQILKQISFEPENWFVFLGRLESNFDVTRSSPGFVAPCLCKENCNNAWDFVADGAQGWHVTPERDGGKFEVGRGFVSEFDAGGAPDLSIQLLCDAATDTSDVRATFDTTSTPGAGGGLNMFMQRREADGTLISQSAQNLPGGVVIELNWLGAGDPFHIIQFETQGGGNFEIVATDVEII